MTSPFSFVVCRVFASALSLLLRTAPLPLNNQSESARLDQLFIRVPLDDGQRMETRIRGADGNLLFVLARVVNVSRLADVPFTFPPSNTNRFVGLHALDYRRVVSSIVNVVWRGSCTVVS